MNDIGVTLPGFAWQPHEKRENILKSLRSSGIDRVRFDLAPPFDQSLDAIRETSAAGIKILLTVNFNNPLYFPPSPGRRVNHVVDWPLSLIDVTKVRTILADVLSRLDAADVHLIGIEIGNEINLAGFNGDLALDSKRCQVIPTNLEPAERENFEKGLRKYEEVARQTRAAMKASRANRDAALIGAGVAIDQFCGSGSLQHSVSPETMVSFFSKLRAEGTLSAVALHYYFDDSEFAVDAKPNSELRSLCSEAEACWLTEWGINFLPNQDPNAAESNRRRGEAALSIVQDLISSGHLHSTFFHSWEGGEPEHDLVVGGVAAADRLNAIGR